MIPPLSQSRFEKMACPEAYATQEVDGIVMPANVFTDRGNDIHRVMAMYVEHCSTRQIGADWAEFDRLAQAVGPDAGEILDGLRDNYVVDHEHFYAAELRLTLDEKLQSSDDTEGYEGTLDALFLLEDNSAYIPDYKSHWRPFDADTFQSKLYPFLVFQNFPHILSVTFELIFVRFKNARRAVTYTRDDLPKLAIEIERARKRQLAIHEHAELFRDSVQALPGSHCVYCPRLSDLSCPLGKMNPYDAGLTPEQRLVQITWMNQAKAHHMAIVKDFVETQKDPVEFEDGNGNKYVASFDATESMYFPLAETMAALLDWREAGDDKTLFNTLRVGSSQLKAKLKAKSRATLDQHLRDNVAVKETKVKFAIRQPDGVVDDGRPMAEEW